MNVNLNTLSPVFTPAAPTVPSSQSAAGVDSQQLSANPVDTVQFSPVAIRELGLAGRIAADTKAGSLSSQQAQQLYSQLTSISSQIKSDRQSNGGTLSTQDVQAIQQLENQLSQAIYTDTGTTAPTQSGPAYASREAVISGRILIDEKSGKLSSSQASQFVSQENAINQQIAADKQANGGTLTQSDLTAINQQQTQLSQQLYQAVHGNTPSNGH